MKSGSYSTFLRQWVRGWERRMYVVRCWDTFACLPEWNDEWMSSNTDLNFHFCPLCATSSQILSFQIKRIYAIMTENIRHVLLEDDTSYSIISHDPVGQMSVMVLPSGFIFNPHPKTFWNTALFSIGLKLWHIYRQNVQIVSTFSVKHSTSCADSVLLLYSSYCHS